jgi:hypothetical protein
MFMGSAAPPAGIVVRPARLDKAPAGADHPHVLPDASDEALDAVAAVARA